MPVPLQHLCEIRGFWDQPQYPFVDMLDTADRRILDFERGWWLFPEPKDWTIAEVLGISAATYYHRLRELLDLDEAGRYDPLTVRRLQRIVDRGI